jgi:ABC-type polysaccharide/polyol phosphate transport system ATPase subunit
MTTIRQYCTRGGILQDGKLELFDTVKEAEAVYEAA